MAIHSPNTVSPSDASGAPFAMRVTRAALDALHEAGFKRDDVRAIVGDMLDAPAQFASLEGRP